MNNDRCYEYKICKSCMFFKEDPRTGEHFCDYIANDEADFEIEEMKKEDKQ